MKLVTTPRIDFLRELAGEILHNYGHGRAIVAVGGPAEGGRAEFADDLAGVLEEREQPVFRASFDDFLLSRAAQDVFGPDSAERSYRHAYDYSALRRVLVEPFRMGGSTGFVTRHFDAARDTWIQPVWLTAPVDATLILDGDFIHRPELRGLWSYSIVLDSGLTEESGAELLYQAEARPRSVVSALVDNADAATPRRLFLDSC